MLVSRTRPADARLLEHHQTLFHTLPCCYADSDLWDLMLFEQSSSTSELSVLLLLMRRIYVSWEVLLFVFLCQRRSSTFTGKKELGL